MHTCGVGEGIRRLEQGGVVSCVEAGCCWLHGSVCGVVGCKGVPKGQQLLCVYLWSVVEGSVGYHTMGFAAVHNTRPVFGTSFICAL